MAEDIFSTEQAIKLATSIAERAGIRVKTLTREGIPRVEGNTIYIGEPSIYSHKEFMEELHKCIGKVCPDNKFFNAVEKEGREDTMKEIIRSMHCDRYLHGEFSGRDRQLASAYSKQALTLNGALPKIAEADPTAAAMLAIGNELRNDWQGYNRVDIPEELEDHVAKFRHLKDDWLSLETVDDLERLLKNIKDIEDEEAQDGEAEEEGTDSGEQQPDSQSGEPGDDSGYPLDSSSDQGDEDSGDDQGSESEGDESDESEEDPSGSDESDQESEGGAEGEPKADEGNGTEPSEDDRELSDGRGESSEGEGEESESDGDDSGVHDGESGSEASSDEQDSGSEGSGGDSGDGGSGESGGQPGDSGSEVGDSLDDSGSEVPEGYGEESPSGEPGTEGSPEDQGERSDSEGRDADLQGEHDSEAPPGDEGERGDIQEDSPGELQDGRELTESPALAYEDAGDTLRDLGVLSEINTGNPVEIKQPYSPCTSVIMQNNIPDSRTDSKTKRYISEELAGFKLTQQVKKYLMTMTQDRWNVGLQAGKLNTAKMYRMYGHTGKGQPRMYKKKQASKLSTDIAVSLLIDNSGSMNYPWSCATKYIIAAACAVAMSEVLQALQIPHDILMFTTGMHKIVHTTVRETSESFVSRDRLIDRLSRQNMRFEENADGEAVMWAAQRIAQRKEAEKLIIVLSDGEPSAYSIGTGYGTETYLRDVVKTIEESGTIDILALGIQNSAVKSFYKKHKVLHKLSELEGTFMQLLQEKLIK